MKFIKIEISSFCSISEANYDLDDQGLVVVRGKNADVGDGSSSNGSGKSTVVVDALCWVLFGKTTKGGSADSVTPGGDGKGTRVAVWVERDGQTFQITRHRKHSSMSNKIVVHKEGEDISRSTASENNKLVESILCITFDTFLYTTVLGPGSFRLSKLTDQGRREILEDITGTGVYEDAKLAARAKAKELTEQIRIDEVRAESKKAEYESLRSQSAQLTDANNNAREAHYKQVDIAKKSVSTAQEALDAAKKAQLALVEPQEVAQLSELEHMLADMQDRCIKLGTRKAKSSALLDHATALLTKATTQKSRVMGQELPCDHCGSVLNDDHIDKVIFERKHEVEGAKAELDSCTHLLDLSNARLNEISSAVHKIKSVQQDHANNVYMAQVSVTTAEQSLEQWNTYLDQVSNSPVVLATSLDKLEQIDETGDLYLAQYHTMLESLETSRKDLESANYWVTGFQNLRVTALESSLDFINSRLTHYSSQLFENDVTVSLTHRDGKITISVSTLGGTYESASGGEKDRVDICLAFALLDLARQCTNWGSNILVMDEIAVHVDSKGVQGLMKVVEDLVGDVASVYMISHNPIFEGYGDKTLLVTRVEGTSTISFD